MHISCHSFSPWTYGSCLFVVSKRYIQTAWRLAIDTFRTLSPLQSPPHELALAALYSTSLLLLTPVNLLNIASYRERLVDPGGTRPSLEEEEMVNVLIEAERWKEFLANEKAFEDEYLTSFKDIDGMFCLSVYHKATHVFSRCRHRSRITRHLHDDTDSARFIRRSRFGDPFDITQFAF